MSSMFRGPNAYVAVAIGVLSLHLFFILWVMFGAPFTKSRPVVRGLHIVSLAWGVFTELAPWLCPLTILENWLESRAGVRPYQGGFMLHYLDALVYPNISSTILTIAAVAVCGLNLGIYARQFWKRKNRRG